MPHFFSWDFFWGGITMMIFDVCIYPSLIRWLKKKFPHSSFIQSQK